MTQFIFHNGTILTQATPSVIQAVLIENGHIKAVGKLKDVRAKASKTATIIDLKGQTLIPAFNDAHIHIWKVGDLLTYMLDLRGVDSVAEMLEKIADFAAKNPNNAWILARGFNETRFADGQMPTRFDLDTILKDRPCYVIRTCAHVAVLNSYAMTLCNITEQTPVPKGGEIRRTSSSSAPTPLDKIGTLSGILTETALGLAQRHLPKYTPQAYRTMILAAQKAFLKQGITAATDPAVMPDLLDVYKKMDADGELKVRINAIPIVVPDGAIAALPLPKLYKSDYLTVNAVKFFADGGLSGKTAAMKTPYNNSNDYGVLRLDYDFFKPLARAAQDAGFKIATHAIGDKTIEMVMKVYNDISPYNKTGIKHRIEHLGLPSADDLLLMRELGVQCVTQPIFLYELGQNFRQYLPPQYLARVYPYRSVLAAGIDLAFSSDAPVVKNFNPLMGIENAVNRQDMTGQIIGETEKITAAQALKAFTLGAATANNDEHRLGSIEVGKCADLVVLDNNPLLEGINIADIKVTQVWVNGHLILQ